MGFDDDDDDEDDNDDDEDAGVIARIPLTKGSLSTLSVDALPFKSLKDLAGRGLVVCHTHTHSRSALSFQQSTPTGLNLSTLNNRPADKVVWLRQHCC